MSDKRRLIPFLGLLIPGLLMGWFRHRGDAWVGAYLTQTAKESPLALLSICFGAYALFILIGLLVMRALGSLYWRCPGCRRVPFARYRFCHYCGRKNEW